ncbi:hypothetical protein A2U01_0017228 [Trifolium medium]|uniref:Uncharacterized protein n=1 Tax=Trifolium medium TaxID=97028 RepID=A0A392NCJ5_9FABA|nr:hypothetical protein [Trifolium medium]
MQEMAQWENGQWMWIFEWHRRLFQWASELVEQLRLSLGCVRLNLADDSWGWVPDNGGPFSVWSTYVSLVTDPYPAEPVGLYEVATQLHSDSREFRPPGSAAGIRF